MGQKGAAPVEAPFPMTEELATAAVVAAVEPPEFRVRGRLLLGAMCSS